MKKTQHALSSQRNLTCTHYGPRRDEEGSQQGQENKENKCGNMEQEYAN